VDEEPQITAEHVREAARRLSPEYNYLAGMQRAYDRAYWFILPACMWTFAFGWTLGAMNDAWNVPWGSYVIAVFFSVFSYVMLRKTK
jgi:hypothetical protein